jgi:hypothetical protein
MPPSERSAPLEKGSGCVAPTHLFAPNLLKNFGPERHVLAFRTSKGVPPAITI